ncbi:hypothetical protein [Bacteroides xylanisolvens]|uniref:hypothetical protein n=1 Tax=Bacteroides xylanisolvens TaxID=371601 RepID=UPI001C3764F5|nr:hypothetical protein [Bacteroides xylanisolvens]MBV3835019.1 hypothetical protein [Bacteroides xylanisolvens]MBV3878081.1 hypothetical protein [Bacteroides xylanisolvens]MBV3883345.1 hypothetical protein [Bacteroides xylanisolvens]MBV3909631.1 hypothetical protein [Bacteroides xylanisolvens]MBV3914891.1 hypothetical protein [Bacteroides xylanisolvens]
MREYYIFRWYDEVDVMNTIHQEFKLMTEEDARSYFLELKSKHYGVAVYKRVLP